MKALTFSFTLIYFCCTFEEAFFPIGEKTERNKGVLQKGKKRIKNCANNPPLVLLCFFAVQASSKMR
jgi:hypothetical protein